jgi:hypothetical protein
MPTSKFKAAELAICNQILGRLRIVQKEYLVAMSCTLRAKEEEPSALSYVVIKEERRHDT